MEIESYRNLEPLPIQLTLENQKKLTKTFLILVCRRRFQT